MDEILDSIIVFLVLAFGLLFGHVGLWSSIAGIISGIVATFFFVVVFVAAVYLARTAFWRGWPRRAAKVVLSLQAIVLSWIAAGIFAVLVYREEWTFSIFWLAPPPFFLSLLLFARWIKRLGHKKSAERTLAGAARENGAKG